MPEHEIDIEELKRNVQDGKGLDEMLESGDEDFELAQLRAIDEAESRARWDRHIKRLRSGDHLCKHCMGCYHQELEAPMLPPDCQLSHQVQMREAREQGIYSNLSPEDQARAEAVGDPVSWAKLMFDWEARDFQREILECSAQRRVIRAGRRVGKTEVAAIELLYLMYIKPNRTQDPTDSYEAIVVCPYEYQVGVIFDKMRKLLYRSPYLASMTDKKRGGADRKDPHQLEFYNGSRATGFTASVKTGGKADKVRGQDANILIIDEMDYLDEGSIESMMALFVSDEHCMIWASSTPSGKRESFFQWCCDKTLGFREFHFTSRVSPQWKASTELFYRSIYSRMGFAHEFLAEFGESESAVFHAQDIENSLERYDWRKCTQRRGCLYTVGVDWNSVAYGTHIVVLEYDFQTAKIKLVHKEIVEPAEFTQKKGVERVIDINEQWNPTYIYVDAGYGAMQIETLHEYGMRNRHTGLRRKVRGIQMGGQTEIRDPASKQKVKKPTKPFVVDCAARRMEVGQCVLPRSEDRRRGLVQQIRNYEVVGRGQHGQPRYTEEGEHTLTAWMLAIFAMVMEHTPISRVTHTRQVRHLFPEEIERETQGAGLVDERLRSGREGRGNGRDGDGRFRDGRLNVAIHSKRHGRSRSEKRPVQARTAKMRPTGARGLANNRRVSDFLSRATRRGRTGLGPARKRTNF